MVEFLYSFYLLINIVRLKFIAQPSRTLFFPDKLGKAKGGLEESHSTHEKYQADVSTPLRSSQHDRKTIFKRQTLMNYP